MELPVNYRSLGVKEKMMVRERYIELQKGMCMWCGLPLSGNPSKKVMSGRINWSLFPKNFMKYPVHLQHCHKTGMTEGAVHARCNAYMWQYHGR